MRSLVFLLLIGVASLTPEAMGSGVMLVTLSQPATLNHVWTCPSLSDLAGKNSCPGMSTNTVLCPGVLEGGGYSCQLILLMPPRNTNKETNRSCFKAMEGRLCLSAKG
ncbi:unnamed protein product [Arctogadus glacialis]